jgi:alkaline phosphatase D
MWAGYPAQRSELLDFVVNEGIENVWFLSGDLHMGAVNRVAPSGPYREIREIMVGPGASTPNPLVGAVELAPVLAEDTVPSEQFDYYSTEHAATLVTFDPLASTVHVRFISAATEDILFERTYPSAGS